jgi:hypothetical protein
MRSKHIHQALTFLYENKNNEQITEDVFRSAITDIHPVDYKELWNGLFLMGFVDKSSSHGELKITDKGIDYLIKNPRFKKDINWIKVATVWSAIFGGLAFIVGLLQLLVSINNDANSNYGYKPNTQKEPRTPEIQSLEKHTMQDTTETNSENLPKSQ